MRTLVAFALLAAAVSADPEHKIPQACESEFSTAKTCMEGALKKEGIDITALHKCFETSTCAQGGDKSSEEEGAGTNGNVDAREAFHKCFGEKFGAQMHTCLAGKNLGFQLVETKGPEGGFGGHHGGHHGGGRGGHHGGGKGGHEGGERGGHGGKGRGGPHNVDIISHLLARAEKCGAGACARAALAPNLASDSAAAKAAFCRALQSCPKPANSQCKEQLHKLKIASCECAQSGNESTIRAECEQSSGFTPKAHAGGGHGGRPRRQAPAGGTRPQRNCAELPEKDHDFLEQMCSSQ